MCAGRGIVIEVAKNTTLSFVSFRWMRRAAGRGKAHGAQEHRARRSALRGPRSPFGKVYEWHPAYVSLECDCGEKVILTAAGTITTCDRCGAGLSAFAQGIQEREGHLPDRLTHPWFYDAQTLADQRLRDEAAYPGGSPWRYDDVTADNG